jgi:tetratricopeptide (TPR) repeat protein
MSRSIILLIVIAALGPCAVRAGSIDDCLHAVDPYQKIAGCTAIIECECMSDRQKAVAFIQRGIGFDIQGDALRAIENINAAIELDPENLNSYFARGTVYNKLGEYEASIQDYDKLYEANFYSVSTLIARGDVYNNMGEYKRAIDDYDEALRLDPGNAEALNDRGTSYLGLGNFQNAIAEFDGAIRNDPRLAIAYHNRAFARIEMGDPAAAISDARTAAAHLPDRHYVHETLGLALCRTGGVEEAVVAFEHAREINPPTPESVEMQLKRLAQQGFFAGRPADRNVAELRAAERAWVVAGCPFTKP